VYYDLTGSHNPETATQQKQKRTHALSHHTYSAYERGVDGLWSMQQRLDRAPLGHNETAFRWRRREERIMEAVRRHGR
jgi:predicted dithiol-disulfide oxidoreductase (DUF899 family)